MTAANNQANGPQNKPLAGFYIGEEDLRLDEEYDALREAAERARAEEEEKEEASLEKYRAALLRDLLRMFERTSLLNNDFIYENIQQPAQKTFLEKTSDILQSPLQSTGLKEKTSLLITTETGEVLVNNDGESRGVYFADTSIDFYDALLGATLALNQRREGDPLTTITGTLEQRWVLTLAAEAAGLELANPVDLNEVLSPKLRDQLLATKAAFDAKLAGEPEAAADETPVTFPEPDGIDESVDVDKFEELDLSPVTDEAAAEPVDRGTVPVEDPYDLMRATEKVATSLDILNIQRAAQTNAYLLGSHDPEVPAPKTYEGIALDVTEETTNEPTAGEGSVIVVDAKGDASIKTVVEVATDFDGAVTDEDRSSTTPPANHNLIAGGPQPKPSA